MAGYSAVIDVRVQGQDAVRALTDSVGRLEQLAKQVKPIPSLFDKRGVPEVVAAKKRLSDLVETYGKGNTNVAKFATSIAGINTQLQAFKTIAANATTGTGNFNNALIAAATTSTKLLEAELTRFNALQQVYNRQENAVQKGPSKTVKDLLDLQKIVPNSVSALERYQKELLDVQSAVSKTSVEYRELEQAIYRTNVALERVGTYGPAEPPVQGPALPPGMSPKGRPPKKPKKGSLAFNPDPTQENLALGAGFPLLFGGGPAQVAGGLIGSFFGGGFGGQILGSAIAQALQDTTVKIQAIGNAAKELNLNALRDSAIRVNAELDLTVSNYLKAGKSTEAFAAANNEVAKQIGVLPRTVQDITNNANLLGVTWKAFTNIVSTTLSILGAPFVSLLTGILTIVNGILYAFNAIASVTFGGIASGIEYVLSLIPGWANIMQFIQNTYDGLTNTQSDLSVELQKTVETKVRELALEQQLYNLSTQRTLGITTQQKLTNVSLGLTEQLAKIESDTAAKKQAAQEKYAVLKSAADKAALEAQLLSIEKEGEFAAATARNNAEHEKLNLILNSNNETIQRQITAIDGALQVTNARIAAEKAINQVLLEQAQRTVSNTEAAGSRAGAAKTVLELTVKQAQLDLKAAYANIEAEISKQKLIQLNIKLREQEIKIVYATAEAQGKVVQAHKDAVTLAAQAVKEGQKSLDVAIQTAKYSKEAAEAVYSGAVAGAQAQYRDNMKSIEDSTKKTAENTQAAAKAVADAVPPSAATANNADITAEAIQEAAISSGEFAANMGEAALATKAAANNIQGLKRTGGVTFSGPQLEPWMERDIAKARQQAIDNYLPGDSIGSYFAGVNAELELRTAFWQRMAADQEKADEQARAEYYGSRNARVNTGSAYFQQLSVNATQPAQPVFTFASAPQISVTTGPVMQQNNANYVTMADLEKAMLQTADGVVSGLRTSSGRYSIGV